MSLVSYEYLPITTLTSVANLEGEIENDNLFYLLPITYFSYIVDSNKIPTCDIKGAILSVRYKKMNRGFPKDKCFKNSIMIDLSMGFKNVSLKLSNKKVQLCGATSEIMSEEAGRIIIAYVKRIQELLDLMHSNLTQTKRTMDWVIQNTEKIIVHQGKKAVICYPPENFDVYKPFPFPKEINDTLARWFIPMMSDYVLHEDYKLHLKYLLTIKRVIITEDVQMLPMEIKMKNSNYKIPFMIHRQKLYNLFKNIGNWIAIYDSTWDTSVKLLRISNAQKSKIINLEEKFLDQYHTFIIFSTGSVTQSGPNPSEIGTIYEEFRTIISENKEKIKMNTAKIFSSTIKIPRRKLYFRRSAPPFEKILDQI